MADRLRGDLPVMAHGPANGVPDVLGVGHLDDGERGLFDRERPRGADAVPVGIAGGVDLAGDGAAEFIQGAVRVDRNGVGRVR